MAKFIKLTYLDNTETWTNVDHLVAFEYDVEHTETPCSRIICTIGGFVYVKETPHQINLLIAT